MNERLRPYDGLTPDKVLDALESAGLRGDGRLLALNSYENRVYQANLEDGGHVVAKFYRPHRWSDAQLLEEHAFAHELAGREVPVVAPLNLNGSTLHRFAEFRLAVYPRRGGRPPELEDEKVLEWIGRFIGRIHAVGAIARFSVRPALDIESFGDEPRRWLLESNLIAPDLLDAWRAVADLALQGIRDCFERMGSFQAIRLHGDCHSGNVLWTDAGPHFVDLDDCLMGPPVQDLWMLLSGSRREMSEQFTHLLEGYSHFASFDARELVLVESLRTLRMIHYSAWLARRWTDPAFPAAFPWFVEPRYWENQILALREQLAAIAEGPLEL